MFTARQQNQMRLRRILTILGISLVALGAISLVVYLFSIAGNPILQDIKAVVDIAGGLVVSVGLIVSGIWAYYKFIKGRLFASKIELDLSHQILSESATCFILFLEVSVQNIGVTRILPNGCHIEISGLKAKEKGLETDPIDFYDWDVSRQPHDSDVRYIEPNEIDFDGRPFSIPKTFDALLASVSFYYDNKNRTNRLFAIPLHG